MLKNIQLELNFNKQEETVDPETGEILSNSDDSESEQTTFRGSKDFIKQMRQELDGGDQ